SSKGYSFDDNSGGGKDPVEELQELLGGECTSFNSFENCLQSPLAATFHDVSGLCRDLHAVNISLLKQHLTDLGAEPKETPGFWQSLSGF
ncbi:hypothetical protein ACJENE_24430, partial [Escherichia coli]